MPDIYRNHKQCVKCGKYHEDRDIACEQGICCMRDVDNVCPFFVKKVEGEVMK